MERHLHEKVCNRRDIPMTRTIEECIDIIENALFEEGKPEIYSVYDQEKDEA